jgi:hypothetical protein
LNIYFAGSISGGRAFLRTYQEMVNYLKSMNHHVLTEHIIDPGVLDKEDAHTPKHIYERDMEWLKSCHYLVAEVSNPSLGVGYEICSALNYQKPVLCLYKRGVFLSRMILGNTRPGLTVIAYENDLDWQNAIQTCIEKR